MAMGMAVGLSLCQGWHHPSAAIPEPQPGSLCVQDPPGPVTLRWLCSLAQLQPED